MAESKDTNREMGEHKPILINCEKWLEADQPDLFVVRCVRHYKGLKTDEILGAFEWDEWEESDRCYTTEVARIVKEIIPKATWSNYDTLSSWYSQAMKFMVEDKSIPFTYAMTFKGSWLTEVHDVK